LRALPVKIIGIVTDRARGATAIDVTTNLLSDPFLLRHLVSIRLFNNTDKLMSKHATKAYVSL
jgi:hypothetical protein